MKDEIATLGKNKDSTRDAFKGTESLIRQLKSEQDQQKIVINNFDSDDLESELKILSTIIQDIENQLVYGQFLYQKQQFEADISKKIIELIEKQNQQAVNIRSAMSKFKSPSKEIKAKFLDWDSDTYNLKTEIDQLPEYIEWYENIKNENIAELETRFRDEFNSGVTKALSVFVNSLELQHGKIENAIEEINESLKNITFNINPDTYIQLDRADTKRPRIRDFRFEKLNSWQPDRSKIALATDQKEAEVEHFVSHIQPFVKELQENEKWRQEVTDVRNWSEFKAREFYKTDSAYKTTYESSGSLSGGEAAQLAYTVLCASLAYQFGITKEKNSRSFRLVVVDEAFSKLDENKSEYLLRLCRNLGLQLMAVTPLTSIQLVENDVSVIHWVTKSNTDKNKSTVRDIAIMEYKQKKESLLVEETTAE